MADIDSANVPDGVKLFLLSEMPGLEIRDTNGVSTWVERTNTSLNPISQHSHEILDLVIEELKLPNPDIK
jgi:hypothetical protein